VDQFSICQLYMSAGVQFNEVKTGASAAITAGRILYVHHACWLQKLPSGVIS